MRQFRMRRLLPLPLILGTLLTLVPFSVQALPDSESVSVDTGVFRFTVGEPRGVALSGGPHPYLIVALGYEGVVILDAGGRIGDRLRIDDSLSEATTVAVVGNFLLGSRRTLLMAVADEAGSRILLRGIDPATGRLVDEPEGFPITGFSVDAAPGHLCFARDPYDDGLYLFAGGEHGLLVQYRIFKAAPGRVAMRPVRTIAIGGETSACVADAAAGRLYITEPALGLWWIDIDPETDPLRRPAALARPYGELREPLALALITHRGGQFPLLADVGAESLLRLSARGKVESRQRFATLFGDSIVDGSVEGIATGRFPFNGKIADVIAVAIEGETGGGEVRLLHAGLFGALAADSAQDSQIDSQVVVRPRVETQPVATVGDAADDPAIWVHPRDPARSLVIATDKKRGIAVYDLKGRQIQFLPDGRINNVDIRSGFDHDGLRYIAAATNRTRSAIAVYAINEGSGHVSRVDARLIPAEFYDPYGLCMYRSHKTGDVYVFATNSTGLLHQWRLFPAENRLVDAELVRRLNVGSIAEGCVADDETGYVYVAEENTAIWRYDAEPDAGDSRAAIARVQPDGELKDDIEGVALYVSDNGGGYIVVSSQGSNSYAVYERKPPHRFRGMFRVGANAVDGIDGASETDGLDVTSVVLPDYPRGLLVVQDGRNLEPDAAQNFKYVSWQDIAEALQLHN